MLIFKQLNLVRGNVLLRVVAHHVCPFEHLSAFHDCVCAFLKKDELLGRIVLHLIKQLHIALELLFLLDAYLFGPLMVIEPLVMELVLQYFVFALLCNLFLLLEFIVVLLEIIVDVASIVPTSGASMLFPIGEAEPTEFMATLLARHVHTALVLFNEARTLGARLRVGLDPSDILAIAALLLLPDLDHGASRWKVILIFAGKAV